jgi:hypothetical protein
MAGKVLIKASNNSKAKRLEKNNANVRVMIKSLNHKLEMGQ